MSNQPVDVKLASRPNQELFPIFDGAHIKKASKFATLDQIATVIRKCKLSNKIDSIRQRLKDGDDTGSRKIKNSLPAFSTSCSGNITADDVTDNHTGFIQIDLDKKSEKVRGEFKDLLVSMESCAMAFTSPSGNGVKGVVRIDHTQHAESANKLITFFKNKGHDVDTSVMHDKSICYISADKDCYTHKHIENPQSIPTFNSSYTLSAEDDDDRPSFDDDAPALQAPPKETVASSFGDEEKKSTAPLKGADLLGAFQVVDLSPTAKKKTGNDKEDDLLPSGHSLESRKSDLNKILKMRQSDAYTFDDLTRMVKFLYKKFGDFTAHGFDGEYPFKEIGRDRRIVYLSIYKSCMVHGKLGVELFDKYFTRRKSTPRDFKRNLDDIGVGSLVHMAKEYGWEDHAFPVECFPDDFRNLITDINKKLEIPTALIASSILGLNAVAMGAAYRIETPNKRSSRGNLFLMPVADSGIGKSQLGDMLSDPILRFEETEKAAFEKNVKPRIESKLRIAKRKLNDKENEAKQLDTPDKDLETAIEELTEEVVALEDQLAVHNEIIIQDATTEALGIAMSNGRNECLGSISFEARQVARVMMNTYGKDDFGTNDALYCDAYSGGATKIARVQRNNIYLKSPCLTLLWSLQPTVARKIMQNEELATTGFFARVLYAECTTPKVKRMKLDMMAVDQTLVDLWQAHVTEVLRHRFNPLTIQDQLIKTKRKSLEAFANLHNKYAELLEKDENLRPYGSYFQRFAENAWRIALNLHIMKHQKKSAKKRISLATTKEAIEIVEYFIAQRLSNISESIKHRDAELLDESIEYIIEALGKTFDENRRNNLPFPSCATPSVLCRKITRRIRKQLGDSKEIVAMFESDPILSRDYMVVNAKTPNRTSKNAKMVPLIFPRELKSEFKKQSRLTNKKY